jgi:hypothetical protein
MITLHETLSENDYRQAFSLHYKTFRMSRWRPVLALVLIVLGGYLLFTTRSMVGFFSVAYGLFMLFREKFWLNRIVQFMKSTRHFKQPLTITITDDGALQQQQGESSTTAPLSSFLGYVRTNDGVLLYQQRNYFLFLKASAFESVKAIDRLEETFAQQNVKKMPLYPPVIGLFHSRQ